MKSIIPITFGSVCSGIEAASAAWHPLGWEAACQCPDGPRYKALGNSMAVPVMHWIGRRIDEQIKRDLEYERKR